MGTVPVLKPREVVALLNQLGFVEARQRGSHKQFKHSDGRSTTVPFHKAVTSRRRYSARFRRISDCQKN